jgi:hypothetical protein
VEVERYGYDSLEASQRARFDEFVPVWCIAFAPEAERL